MSGKELVVEKQRLENDVVVYVWHGQMEIYAAFICMLRGSTLSWIENDARSKSTKV